MLDMGAEPFLVASTVNVIIAQRLVRRLCVECKKSYKLDAKEIDSLGKLYDLESLMVFLKKDPLAKKPMEKINKWEDITFYKAVGCDQCTGGYKGRIGIYEVLEMESNIRKLVTQSATSEAIENQARENGMATMVEDGFLKIVMGTTSLEEVMSATKE
jgi:type II secretory ATPase GspE/PulE/Tfp pilus assembly ATPase PilB-like protein